ncbi:uncharacterized protein [Physcomitrium patens]|uniref:uncharacterized protein isoform X2 n=1 Tax=Physcomitrium patens TaxID=3218 RepID=UPI000D1702B4|nr:uncharacterized protein LOC112275996 isoform X2 [Physcomitrium patens]|eukprot:XP_024362666.1 uncharacterized protein LOC112275996 isoform X2 [Physcomitrella patens]
MAPKKISYTPVQAVVLPQEQKPPEVIPSEPAKPTYDDQWFDDPIEGEEAIRMEQQLRQKIEEKAEPVRTWLEKNIVPILLQALEAVCAHRPSNPHEFLAAYLLKYNPLKDTYPEDDPKPKKVMEEENIEDDNEDDPCGCDRFKRKEPPKPDLEPTTTDELAKKNSILADAKQNFTVDDPIRELVTAQAKSKDSVKK